MNISKHALYLGLLVASFMAATTFGVATQEEASNVAQGESAPQDGKSQDETSQDPPGKIRFSFSGEEWSDVIDWFVEQNGFSLYTIVDPPEGTFTYIDDQEYTVLEGLDQLNQALMLQGGYTLIRNRQMLVLTNEDEGYPDELIEEVTPEQLPSRGRYEIVRCVFDMSHLENSDVVEDVERMIRRVHRDGFVVIDSAKKMIVRETGETLRLIDSVVELARKNAIEGNMEFEEYIIKHIEAETLLITVRELMGIDEDSNRMDDDSLSFSVDPTIGRHAIFLKGTAESISEFIRIAKMVDVDNQTDDGEIIEKPFLKSYATSGEPEIIFQVMNTMFEGENVRMELDDTTGNVILLGTSQHHERFVNYLNALSDTGSRFAAIQLQYEDPDDVLLKLQTLLGVNPDEPGTSKGPSLYADTVKDQILVSGTPQEIAQIKNMIEAIDTADSFLTGPRTRKRVLQMTPYEADRVMGMLQDLWGTSGRENRLKLVMPEDRATRRSRIRGRESGAATDQDILDLLNQLDDLPDTRSDDGDDDDSGSFPTPLTTRTISQFKQAVYTGDQAQDDQDQEIGQTSQEQSQDDGYRPPRQVPSIPDSEITAKQTEFGIVLDSEDLDALDDLVAIIMDVLDSSSGAEMPHIFFLKHRKATEAKGLMDDLLGLSDSGGGGGGGLGGMMGGMLSNAIGGAAGNALGGLLGGGGGLDGGTAGIELEGDVRIGTDVKFNTLIVSGATSLDLDIIAELIEYVDAPEPPVDLELLGQTYYIPVVHRDPVEMMEKVKTQFADLIKKEQAVGGNNPQAQQAQQAAQMMRAFQQLAGGRGRGGNANSDPEQEKPVATIGVDESTRMILVTGPKFIYLLVSDLVQTLDVPDTTQSTRMVVPVSDIDSVAVARTLKAMLGDKADLIIGGEEQSSASGSTNNNRNRSTSSASSGTPTAVSNPAQNQMREAIMRAMQQRGGGSTRGGTRGGFGGGGGRGGGGARGGRGGR